MDRRTAGRRARSPAPSSTNCISARSLLPAHSRAPSSGSTICVDLGVTHIELMPVNQFSGERGWGYDGVDLFAPHQAYGTPDDLKRLVNACHAKGLAVLLDVVYNHLGPEGNYLARFGPYFTRAYNTPWGAAVNFDDRDSDEVRRFFIDNAFMWLRDYHFDGLRLDAVHAILRSLRDNLPRKSVERGRCAPGVPRPPPGADCRERFKRSARCRVP